MPVTLLNYIDGSPPVGYSLAFEPFLYNQENFLALKNYPVQSFYVVDHQKRSIEARIHFAIRKQKDDTLRAISLPELPFGSLEYSDSLTEDQAADFLSFVQESLARKYVQAIEIRDCIIAYRTGADVVYQSLQKLGYQTLDEPANYHIIVDGHPLVTKVTDGQQNKLNKATKNNFIATIEPSEKISEIYEFIAMSYQTRQRKLSLPLSDLLSYAKTYPGRYLLFSVYHLRARIAACIAVQVSSSTVYTFYYTALLTYSSYSPTVLLLSHIYRYCQSNNTSLLDLGIGSESVQNFKRRMGGTHSCKRSYLLEW